MRKVKIEFQAKLELFPFGDLAIFLDHQNTNPISFFIDNHYTRYSTKRGLNFS